MTIQRSFFASALAASLAFGWGGEPARIVNRPRAAPPTRSRQRPKGWRYCGGTGQLRRMRPREEQLRRIAAAQAKRERRQLCNLAELRSREA